MQDNVLYESDERAEWQEEKRNCDPYYLSGRPDETVYIASLDEEE